MGGPGSGWRAERKETVEGSLHIHCAELDPSRLPPRGFCCGSLPVDWLARGPHPYGGLHAVFDGRQGKRAVRLARSGWASGDQARGDAAFLWRCPLVVSVRRSWTAWLRAADVPTLSASRLKVFRLPRLPQPHVQKRATP